MVYLPHLYEKIKLVDIGDYYYSDNINLTNIEVSFPEPKEQFINNWDTQLLSEDNSLVISTLNQNMVISADYNFKTMTYISSTGSLRISLSDVDLSWNMIFTEQTANEEAGTGMSDLEMAPAIDISFFDLSIDDANSSIVVEGTGIPGWIVA